ncbi:MAG: hypothetical protein C0468_00410 [Planctomyces sp.]|nr:hypothetical protein [Planctomyces sp.]MBA4119289.1 hypothetical protein [Isosphaera sp.]
MGTSRQGVDMDRRRALAIAALLSAGALAPGLWRPSAALAQPRNTGGGRSARGPSIAQRIFTRQDQEQWLLRADLLLQSPVLRRIIEGVLTETDASTLRFDEAAIVFPIVESTASSRFVPGDLAWQVRVSDRQVPSTFTFIGGLQSGSRLGSWRFDNPADLASNVRLNVDIPLDTWNLRFDERAAMEIAWSPPVSQDARTGLEPQAFVEYVRDPAEAAQTRAELAPLIERWLGKRDPAKLRPVEAAKTIAAGVLEHVQVSGNGLVASRNGQLAGFELGGAALTARQRRGSEHEMTALLAAALRQIGLPTRTVIAVDDAPRGAGLFNANLRSWVEFWALTPDTQDQLWIPVDVARQRRSGSRAPRINQAWKYFGAHDETERLLPVALQFHPPVPSQAFGVPAFWGWRTRPEVEFGTQALRFNVSARAIRGGQRPVR